jgi:hypothetical protein
MPVKRNYDRLDVEEADASLEAIRVVAEEAFDSYFSYHLACPGAHPLEVPGDLADMLDQLQTQEGGCEAACTLLLDAYARLHEALKMLAEVELAKEGGSA